MKNRKIRCKNCGNYFYPDHYNYRHQQYCSRRECRKASHIASAKLYRKSKSLDKEFRKNECKRVKKWQAENSDYWKDREKTSKKVLEPAVLRDFAQVQKLQSDMTVLRDFANSQYHVIEGLIITLTGDVLRDNIGGYIRQMYDKGREVSGKVPENDFIMQLKRKRMDNGNQNVNRSSS